MASGIGNAVFGLVSGIWPRRWVWRWTALGISLCLVGILQLVTTDFLPYWGVWFTVMFAIGAVVGVGRTNCIHAIKENFEGPEYDDATRSTALGFAGAGNFVGDAIGGGFAIMTERLAMTHLKPTKW